jgi:hypothetical protein
MKGHDAELDWIIGPDIVSNPPWARSLYANKTWGLFLFKWFLPAACMGLSMFVMFWWLHVATTYYIYMEERNTHLHFENAHFDMDHLVNVNNSQYAYPFLSPGLYPTNVSYGSLEDPLEGELGWTSVDMGMLDTISAGLPALWFVSTLLTDDLQHWTKMLICNSFLAVLKGFFGWATIVPDSIGWGSCKKRLGAENLEKMKRDIANPGEGFFSVFWSVLVFEVKNVFGVLTGKPMIRFCADMMFSGHTYFTTLYALGLVELTRRHTKELSPHWQWFFLILVYIVCISEQVIEIVLVLRNRFHYTMDVAMALLLSLLFFTNATIGVVARKWYFWGRTFKHDREDDAIKRQRTQALHDMPEGVKQWIDQNQVVWIRKEAAIDREKELPPDVKEWFDAENITWMSVGTSGETWTPICCVPFCCLFGRYHILEHEIFSESQAENLREQDGEELGSDDEERQLTTDISGSEEE